MNMNPLHIILKKLCFYYLTKQCQFSVKTAHTFYNFIYFSQIMNLKNTVLNS